MALSLFAFFLTYGLAGVPLIFFAVKLKLLPSENEQVKTHFQTYIRKSPKKGITQCIHFFLRTGVGFDVTKMKLESLFQSYTKTIYWQGLFSILSLPSIILIILSIVARLIPLSQGYEIFCFFTLLILAFIAYVLSIISILKLGIFLMYLAVVIRRKPIQHTFPHSSKSEEEKQKESFNFQFKKPEFNMGKIIKQEKMEKLSAALLLATFAILAVTILFFLFSLK